MCFCECVCICVDDRRKERLKEWLCVCCPERRGAERCIFTGSGLSWLFAFCLNLDTAVTNGTSGAQVCVFVCSSSLIKNDRMKILNDFIDVMRGRSHVRAVPGCRTLCSNPPSGSWSRTPPPAPACRPLYLLPLSPESFHPFAPAHIKYRDALSVKHGIQK